MKYCSCNYLHSSNMQVHDTSYEETDAEDEKDQYCCAPEREDGREEDEGVSLKALKREMKRNRICCTYWGMMRR